MDRRSAALLLLLGALRPPPVLGSGFLLLPVQLAPVPCSDRALDRLARLAVTYINEDREDGYKFALNRVTNVHLHAQGPAGSVYYLDLEVLETKCPSGSSRPWRRCSVRPFMETQVSGNCNTTVLQSAEGYSYLYSYACALEPDPPGKLQQTCPTCPTLLSVDAPQAMAAARLSLAAFQRKNALAAGLGVKKITRAAVQTRPAPAHFVEFSVQRCPEGVSQRGTCRRLTLRSDTETAGFCSGAVSGPLDHNAEAQVSCEMFSIQDVGVARPALPQGHDLRFPQEATDIPTPPPPTDGQRNNPRPAPSDPPLPPAVRPAPFHPARVNPAPLPPAVRPAPFHPAPLDPDVVENPPASPSPSSSSSESSESVEAPPPASSSEETASLVARRPPSGFRYQGRGRDKRQALVDSPPPHTPVFLTDFPAGPSPFRSCPGPARFTTV